MMKHIDMIQLIGDLCMEEFIAGGKTDVDSVKSARAMRARLFDAVRDLYAELEHESYEREQFEVELKKANEELERRIDEKHAILNGTPCEGLRQRLYKIYGNKVYGSKLTEDDEEVPDHHDAFDAMFPGCTPDDLPFPDVDDLAGASLLGGDE